VGVAELEVLVEVLVALELLDAASEVLDVLDAVEVSHPVPERAHAVGLMLDEVSWLLVLPYPLPLLPLLDDDEELELDDVLMRPARALGFQIGLNV